MAQRLVRRLCQHCKTPADLSDSEMRALRIEPGQLGEAQVMRPVGCDRAHLGVKRLAQLGRHRVELLRAVERQLADVGSGILDEHHGSHARMLWPAATAGELPGDAFAGRPPRRRVRTVDSEWPGSA